MQDFIDMSIIRSVPRWTRRSYYALTKLHANAIVYIIDGHDEPYKNEDYKAFEEIVVMTQTAEIATMVPILATLSDEPVLWDVP